MQGEVNIKKDESGNKISKQMNTWALLSNWSHDDFHNEPLVTSLNSPKYPFDCSFAPVEIAILLWKPFIDLSLHKPPFRVFSSCFSFLGMPLFPFFLFFFLSFFLLFHCAFKNLNFVQNEWNFFISLRKKLFSSSTCIWSKWTFKVRNVGQVRVYTRRG